MNQPGIRRKIHVITSQNATLIGRAVRLLASRGIDVEIGSTFVKFARGEPGPDQAAQDLKSAGFRVLTSMDVFEADTDGNLAEKSASLLAADAPKGHVHGPGCGHDHAHDESCNHPDHQHGHDHGHGHGHDHDHSHDHGDHKH